MKITPKFLNLEKVKVDIEEFAPNSSYFSLINFNGKLTSGKNAVYISLKNLLKEGSEILVECLDSTSKPLVTSTRGVFNTKNVDLVVSVIVYDYTPQGDGKIVLLGTDKNGKKVRWSSPLYIYPKLQNISDIILATSPEIEVLSSIQTTCTTELEQRHLTNIPFDGIPVSPKEGTKLEWDSENTYLLKTNSPFFSSDMIGEQINIDGENYPILNVINSFTANIVPITDSSQRVAKKSGNFSIKYYPTNSSPHSHNIYKRLANIECRVKNIECYTGNIHRYNIFKTSLTSTGNEEFVGSGQISDIEYLIDYDTPFTYLSNVGKIINQMLLDTYWHISEGNATINHSSESMIDSLTVTRTSPNSSFKILLKNKISGESNSYIPYNKSEYLIPDSASRRSNFIKLLRNTEYKISFDYIPITESPSSEIAIYLISSVESIKNNKLYDGNGVLIYKKSNVKNNSKYSERVSFLLNEDFFGTLSIHIKNLDLTIGNISIKADVDPSFSPKSFIIKIPVDVRTKNEGCKFRMELVNCSGEPPVNFKSGLLTDIIYLDPMGITTPFNVLRREEELAFDFETMQNRISSLYNFTASLSGSVVDLQNKFSVLSGSISGSLSEIKNQSDRMIALSSSIETSSILLGLKFAELSSSLSGFNNLDINATNVKYNNVLYTTVASALDHLLYIPIQIPTFSGGGNYEKGTTIASINFNWTLNKPVLSQTISGVPVHLLPQHNFIDYMNIYKYTSDEMQILNLKSNLTFPVDPENEEYIIFLSEISNGNIPYQKDSIPMDINFYVTRRQLKQYLIEVDLIHKINKFISDIKDTKQKMIFENWWNESQTFERFHPITIDFGKKLNLTPEAVDQIFYEASKL